MITECDEIAGNMPDRPKTWAEARKIVRALWPDEGEQLRDNLAEALLRKTDRSARR